MKRIIHLLLIAGILAFAPSCKKEGCMDSKATNYNSKAKKDDGSCIFPTDTTTNKDTVDTDKPKILLVKENCVDCITSSGFVEMGKDIRFNIRVTYDSSLSNFKLVRNKIGSITTTLIDTSISGTMFEMEYRVLMGLQTGENSIFTFTATAQNGKKQVLTIDLKAGAELDERLGLLLYRANPDGDMYPYSFNLENTITKTPSNAAVEKDITEASTTSGAFMKKFKTENGSKFKKHSVTKTWIQYKTNADLQAAWDGSGAELNEVDVDVDAFIVIKSGQTGKLYLLYIEEIEQVGSEPENFIFKVKGEF